MKRFRIFLTVLCILMLLSCLCFSSCRAKKKDADPSTDPNHSHEYTEVVTKKATCTETGEKKLICTCGATTVEAVAALGHDYDIIITKYPSAEEKGSKTFSCRRNGCSHSYTEEIDALVATLPSISELLAPLVGERTVTLSMKEDSKVIYTTEVEYEGEAEGYRDFLTVSIADFKLGAENGVMVGHLKLVLSMVSVEAVDGTDIDDIPEPSICDTLASLTVYLNGDDVSVELSEEYKDAEGYDSYEEYNILEAMSKAFGDAFGVDEDMLIGLINVGMELEDYIPLIEGVFGEADALIPENLPENISALADLLGGSIIIESTDEDGNTVYEINMDLIKDLLDDCGNATVAEFIDGQYGEGTAEALIKFINQLPDKKIKDIALSAITLAETYGIDVDATYELVNYAIYLTSGQLIDVGREVENRYNLTIAEMLADESGYSDYDEFADQLKAELTALTDVIRLYTVDQLYNLWYFGDPDYSFDGETAVSITDELGRLIDDYGFAEIVTLVVDPEGCVIGVTIGCGDVCLGYSDDSEGGYSVFAEMPDVFSFMGSATVTEEILAVSGIVFADGQSISLDAEISEDSAYLVMTDEEEELELVAVEVVFGEDMTLESIAVDINGLMYEYDYTDDTSTRTPYDMLTASVIFGEDMTLKSINIDTNGIIGSYDEDNDKYIEEAYDQLTVSVTVGEDNTPESIEVDLSMSTFVYDHTEDNGYYTYDVYKLVVIDILDILVEKTDGSDEYELYAEMLEEQVLEGVLLLLDDGFTVYGEIDVYGDTLVIAAAYTAENISMQITDGAEALIELYVAFDAEGVLDSASLNARYPYYEYDPVLDEDVICYEDIANLAITRDTADEGRYFFGAESLGAVIEAVVTEEETVATITYGDVETELTLTRIDENTYSLTVNGVDAESGDTMIAVKITFGETLAEGETRAFGYSVDATFTDCPLLDITGIVASGELSEDGLSYVIAVYDTYGQALGFYNSVIVDDDCVVKIINGTFALDEENQPVMIDETTYEVTEDGFVMTNVYADSETGENYENTVSLTRDEDGCYVLDVKYPMPIIMYSYDSEYEEFSYIRYVTLDLAVVIEFTEAE